LAQELNSRSDVQINEMWMAAA